MLHSQFFEMEKGIPQAPPNNKGSVQELEYGTGREIVENRCQRRPSLTDAAFNASFSERQRKAVRRKLDLYMMTLVCLVYFCATLTRFNLGIAFITGLSQELLLSGSQMSLLFAIFFAPYVMLEVPSNMILKALTRPAGYMGAQAIGWGISAMLQGAAKSFPALIACRLMIGVFQAGFYPGLVYLMGNWYEPQELSFRVSLLSFAGSLSGILSGPIIAGITSLNNAAGVTNWRWIFLLEGGASVIVGTIAIFGLVNEPYRSSLFTEHERRYLRIQQRIRNGGNPVIVAGSVRDNIDYSGLIAVAKKWQVWVIGLLALQSGAMMYGLKLVGPRIIHATGVELRRAQALTAIPAAAAAAAATCVSFSWWSDRLRLRSPFIVVSFFASAAVCMIVLILVVDGTTTKSTVATVALLATLTAAEAPIIPAMLSWLSGNLFTAGERAVGIALVVSGLGIGGFAGSFLYHKDSDAGLIWGFAWSIAICFVGGALSSLLTWSYWRENKNRAKMPIEEVRERFTTSELAGMGERSPLVRYNL